LDEGGIDFWRTIFGLMIALAAFFPTLGSSVGIFFTGIILFVILRRPSRTAVFDTILKGIDLHGRLGLAVPRSILLRADEVIE